MKVVIADDHSVVRDGLRWMLSSEDGIEIVGDVANGEELLAFLAVAEHVDVVLLDLRMPDLTGFDVLERLETEAPGVHAVVLSMHDEPAVVKRALALGACGYLLKNAERTELVKALHLAASGGGYIQGEVSGMLVGAGPQNESQPAPTPREQQILQLIADGLENKQIATKLELSEATVKSYLKNAYNRLDVNSRAEAVAVALRLGLID